MKKGSKKTLVLLDAHAIIHRGYHALPDFASSKGEPTGALYGLSAMLIRIAQELTPDYMVACFDRPEATHRHDVYDGYKATRAKTDDALVAQLTRARDVFAAFHIPIYEAAGFEADDCLGTIVEKTKKEKDLEIIIASGDMDTLQLVEGTRVRVYTFRKGMNDTVLYDEQAVLARYGFSPRLVPDYKGLRGDPSDNIKGVKGIGEKAATSLVQAFGSVDNIYQALREQPEKFSEEGISPRIVTLLKEGEDDAVFSRMLATIRTDAPIAWQLPKERWKDAVQLERILALFDELEFRTLGARARALLAAEGETEGKERTEETLSPEDDVLYSEAAVMLWLLHSERSDPTKEDILRYTRQNSLKEAHEALLKEVHRTGRLGEVFAHIEKPLIPILERMREVGVLIDVGFLKALSEKYHKELAVLAGNVYRHAGHEFNINSPKQLGEVLFSELQLSIPRHKKTSTGAPSTRESELEKLREAHPVIGDILAYRELQKLLSTYIDTLPALVQKDGRLHARFVQTGTTTGRISSEDPNVQNIPVKTEQGKRVREAFVAPKGRLLLAIDYSQIELRIAAGLSKDEELTRIFIEGGDVHEAVAARVFNVPKEKVDKEMRRRAKVINFGIIYGMGVNALRVNLGDGVSRDDAARFLSEYFASFPGLARFLEETRRRAAAQGYTETLFGRRRSFSGFQSSLPHIRAQAERMAVNAPIQGTQADIIKKAMIEADAWIEREGKRQDLALLLQVHDELIYEVREEEVYLCASAIRGIMEGIVSPRELGGVPIRAEASVGKSWGSLTKIAL